MTANGDLRPRRDGDQSYPIVNDLPSMHDKARRDLERRKSVGVQRYGVALQPANGRDAVRDWYEEALDGLVYGAQVAWELEHPGVTYVGLLVRELAKYAPQRTTVDVPYSTFIPDGVVDYLNGHGIKVERT